jgi:hypothetical protein
MNNVGGILSILLIHVEYETDVFQALSVTTTDSVPFSDTE